MIHARSKRASRDDANLLTVVAPGRCCIATPAPDASGNLTGVSLLAIARQEAEGGGEGDDPRDTLLHWFGNAHRNFADLLEHVTTAEYLPALSAPPATDWYNQQAVLLGDACHGVSIYPTHQTGAPLEDAWVLATMMERWEDEPHSGFHDYTRYRAPRARQIKAGADAFVRELTEVERGAIWGRNTRWSLTSRFLPEIAMKKMDWLYSYDCVLWFCLTFYPSLYLTSLPDPFT